MTAYRHTTALVILGFLLASTETVAAEEATAHRPQYDNRNLWPHDVEKTDYFREKWSKAPVMVWAATGEGSLGEIARVRADLRDPTNWRIDGEPAKRLPDRETDVVFPAGNYSVRTSGDGKLEARHLTVESGARVSFPKADVYGNLWIKKGGSFARAHGAFSGWDKSNFCRNDNDEPHFIANFFTHNKKPGTSTEWIGKWQVGDEVNMISGRFIVAPGSTFMPTDRRTQHVQTDAELVLMSGSSFYMRGNYYQGIDLQIDGKLLAGTPERPLTKDCTLGLSFKGQTSKHDLDIGLVVTEEASLVVQSADPENARLVLRWHGVSNPSGTFKDGEPPEVAAKPHGIRMLLMGDAQLNGVEFQDVLKGGIMMPNPSLRTRWHDVFYGKGNFGSPDELFVPWDKAGPRAKTGPGRRAE